MDIHYLKGPPSDDTGISVIEEIKFENEKKRNVVHKFTLPATTKKHFLSPEVRLLNKKKKRHLKWDSLVVFKNLRKKEFTIMLFPEDYHKLSDAANREIDRRLRQKMDSTILPLQQMSDMKFKLGSDIQVEVKFSTFEDSGEIDMPFYEFWYGKLKWALIFLFKKDLSTNESRKASSEI